MKGRLLTLYKLLVVAVCLTACQQAQPFKGKWNLVGEPTNEKPKVYGGYAAGCFDGGTGLENDHQHYAIKAHTSDRIYGHPSLITFIELLAAHTHNIHDGQMLISDLSYPRGGPPEDSSLHKSHQSGLDVDIWYRYAKSGENADTVKSVSTIKKGRFHHEFWSPEHVTMLKYAASYKDVTRIFVTPYVKDALCTAHKGEAWLRKIRPWYGHSYHFHVRLRCPKESKECKSQAPVPKGDGCDASLAWWFSDEAKQKEAITTKRNLDVVLPKQCKMVYNWRPEWLESLLFE